MWDLNVGLEVGLEVGLGVGLDVGLRKKFKRIKFNSINFNEISGYVRDDWSPFDRWLIDALYRNRCSSSRTHRNLSRNFRKKEKKKSCIHFLIRDERVR